MQIKILLRDQESASRDAERYMMVESSPSSVLGVIQLEFLLELLTIPLDAPAEFRRLNQAFDRCVGEQSR